MPAKTLAQFRTQIAAKLSLDVTDSDELDLIDGWINDGVEHIVGKTACKVAIATMSATANVGDYELDAAILRILWLQSSATGTNSEWEPASPSDILRLRLNGSASSPTLRYAVDGANMLMLYPVPASADTITVRYVPRPAVLDDAADTPSEIPGEFHRLVTLYALYEGGDYDDDQSSAQGERYRQELAQGLTEMKSQINKKRGRRLPRATPGRRAHMPHGNDVDLP